MSDIAPLKRGINAWSPEFIENLYHQWQANRESVDPQWQAFFEGFDLGLARTDSGDSALTSAPSPTEIEKHIKVASLVYHYRDIGHLKADLDPLGVPRKAPEHLSLDAFGLSEADLNRSFNTTVFGLSNPAPLRDIISHLERTYCGTLGAEYMHIQNTAERRWLQEQLETVAGRPQLPAEDRRYILKKLHQAESFEAFLQKAYPSEKRFSLEGGETLIPIMAKALDSFSELGVVECVIGMAHRGRLNVLANVLNKGFDDIFAEFEQNYVDSYSGGGDVKYHKGFSSNVVTSSGRTIYLTLAANPSHLEAVDPVVLGRTRAKQRSRGDKERKLVTSLLIHGDAAFAGQGIVAETLQMMHLPGYTTGGTLHLIINNQIGFTTNPAAARSTTYCTDVAMMVQAPIFHVNAEDPDMCAFAVRIAAEYRQTFGKDVVIDMWCYRKYGHNEGDEPAYTQPRMYNIIRNKKGIRSIYANRLVADGVIDQSENDRIDAAIALILNEAHEHGRKMKAFPNQAGFRQRWDGFDQRFTFDPVETAVSREILEKLSVALDQYPEGFTPNSKLKRLLSKRYSAVAAGESFDWGTGETLAYATLLAEGTPIRITGQDCGRGTFSHRHAVIVDSQTEEIYIPLNHLGVEQADFEIHDSLLAEVSVLGYEYGVSIAEPTMLVMWEAQFGDFANGAQVIIDQFIASAESKWERASGLVMLLPHGYEGQGPEHSSARLERFLQLCAEDNMQVCNLTTPAQFFHLLRRQMKRRFRKPLVLMTPKSLLRHPEAVSTVDDLTSGTFAEILDDPFVTKPNSVRRLLLCSGKVYYDLIARRREVETSDTAIIRLEQIYPLHAELLEQIVGRYGKATEVVWVQEEPRNMGAWSHISEALRERLNINPIYVGRPAAATPAVGSKKLHEKEQRDLLLAALPAPSEATVVSVK